MKKILLAAVLLCSLSVLAGEKVKVANSEVDNQVSLSQEQVKADANACLNVELFLDKKEPAKTVASSY